jgi:diaminopimelate epimerase
MRIFNSDGSEAEMCGNGIRCFGKLVYQSGLTRKKNMLIATQGGLMKVNLKVTGKRVSNVTVRLPEPRMVDDYSDKRLPAPAGVKDIIRVQLSNPHCVVFVNTPAVCEITAGYSRLQLHRQPNYNTDKLDIASYGPVIERHRLFPNRTNVEFVQVLSRNRIAMRVWERGVGETLACGTGACAAVVAGISAGKLDNAVTVQLKGGDLHIKYAKGKGIYLAGGAEIVYKGVI